MTGDSSGRDGGWAVHTMSHHTVGEDMKTVETTEWKHEQEKKRRMVTPSTYHTWLTKCPVRSKWSA